MLRRHPAAVALFAALSILMAGCSDDDAHLRELSRYTPENLSQELLSRYKRSLTRPPGDAKAKVAAKSGRSLDDGGKEREAAAKYGEEFSGHDAEDGAKGMSVDELAANVAKKAKLIEGLAPGEILSKLSAAVDADADLSAADKDKLKAALKASIGA